MTKFTYDPSDGGDTVTEVFGQVVEAGDTIEVKDERQAKKLEGNPEFRSSGTKSKDDDAAKDRAKNDEKIAKITDGRSKEAREARAKAAEADQDAAAKERAAEQAQAIAAARQAKDDE